MSPKPRRDTVRVASGSSPRKGQHSRGPCSAHSKIHVSQTGIIYSHCCPETPGTPRIPSCLSPWSSPCTSTPLEPPNPPRLSRQRCQDSGWNSNLFFLLPHGKQGGVRSRCGAPAPTDLPRHTFRPCQGGQKRFQAGKFSRAAPSAAKSLWPHSKSHQFQAWCIPQQTAQDAHRRSGGPMERWEGSALPSSILESLPSWHSQALTRWQCPGHNVTVVATQGHSDSERNSRERPGPGPGGPLAPHSTAQG